MSRAQWRSTEVVTMRQRQVLDGARKGLTERQIAAKLKVSPLTVRKHLRAARKRLGALDTTHAVACCYERGIFTPKGGDRS